MIYKLSNISAEDIEKEIASQDLDRKTKGPFEDINLLIDKNQSIDQGFLDKLLSIKFKKYLGRVHIIVEDKEPRYNEEETKQLVDINNKLIKNNNIKNGIEFNYMTLFQVIAANRKLNDIIVKINNAVVNDEKLSPFEKFLYAYQFVTDIKYKMENKNEDSDASRNLIKILNSDKIVCVGFSSLLRHICDSIGIFCVEQDVIVQSKNSSQNHLGAHRNNKVYLKDEKYGIDGVFYCDACWDSLNENNEKFLNFCLIPYEDTNKLKDTKINFEAGFYFDQMDEAAKWIQNNYPFITFKEYKQKLYNSINQELRDNNICDVKKVSENNALKYQLDFFLKNRLLYDRFGKDCFAQMRDKTLKELQSYDLTSGSSNEVGFDKLLNEILDERDLKSQYEIEKGKTCIQAKSFLDAKKANPQCPQVYAFAQALVQVDKAKGGEMSLDDKKLWLYLESQCVRAEELFNKNSKNCFSEMQLGLDQGNQEDRGQE